MRAETLNLDTSGRVECATTLQPIGWIIWSDLTPFQQGYVRGMLESVASVAHRTRPPCKLSDGQIWLLKCGRGGFSRVTLRVPYSGHGSTATNYQCAGLIRRGWLEESRSGIVRITEAGERALHTAMPLAFSDLHPATLARAIEDCAFGATLFASEPETLTEADGADLWRRRQRGEFLRFPTTASRLPPLTLSLGEDGKVVAS